MGTLHVAHARQLIDILHVSHMFDIQPGVQFAIGQLLEFNLHPAHRLRLASRYHLAGWISHVVRDLLQLPLPDYTTEDIEHIGVNIFIIIATAKEKISIERKRFTNYVPFPKNSENAPFCLQHTTCKKVWYEVWFTVIVRRIHSVTDYIPLVNLPAELQSTDHNGINLECKRFIIEWIQDSPHLQVEERIITNTVDSINDLCGIL